MSQGVTSGGLATIDPETPKGRSILVDVDLRRYELLKNLRNRSNYSMRELVRIALDRLLENDFEVIDGMVQAERLRRAEAVRQEVLAAARAGWVRRWQKEQVMKIIADPTQTIENLPKGGYEASIINPLEAQEAATRRAAERAAERARVREEGRLAKEARRAERAEARAKRMAEKAERKRLWAEKRERKRKEEEESNTPPWMRVVERPPPRPIEEYDVVYVD